METALKDAQAGGGRLTCNKRSPLHKKINFTSVLITMMVWWANAMFSIFAKSSAGFSSQDRGHRAGSEMFQENVCEGGKEGGGGCHAAAEAGGRTSYASQARCRWWAYTKLATTSEIFSTRGSLNLNVVNFHRWICHLAPSRLHLDVSTNVSSSSPLTPRHASSTSAHLSSRVGHTLTGLPRISATYSSRTADCGGKFLSLAFFSFVPN